MIEAELVSQFDAAGFEKQLHPSVNIGWLVLELAMDDFVEHLKLIKFTAGFELE